LGILTFGPIQSGRWSGRSVFRPAVPAHGTGVIRGERTVGWNGLEADARLIGRQVGSRKHSWSAETLQVVDHHRLHSGRARRRRESDCNKVRSANMTIRERYRAMMDGREARGIILLREWLSPMQRAQFDASKYFDVVGCDSGTRYRIHYGRVTNVQEIASAGQPVTGWCFVPSGHLVAGDVMLAQKIALETNERATLAGANRFDVQVPGRRGPPALPRRACAA
jgi:hypothetical protein